MKEIKTVGLIGLGALGVMYAERLTDAGANLIVIADEQRAVRYIREGVYSNGKKLKLNYRTPLEAEPVDLLIIATKYGGLFEAMETAAPFVGQDTLMLSVINGVISEEKMAERFGPENVLYAVAQGTDATKVGNQLVYGKHGVIVVGEKEPGVVSERVKMVTDYLDAHGLKGVPVPDMVRRQWGKLMLNVGLNQTVMVFEGDYSTVQVPGKPRDTMIAAMREVQTLSALEGYPLPEEEFAEWIAMVDSLTPTGKPSMRQDGEAHRKSEVELFAGTINRLGEKHGVPTPVNQWLYKTVQEMEAAY